MTLSFSPGPFALLHGVCHGRRALPGKPPNPLPAPVRALILLSPGKSFPPSPRELRTV